MIYCSMLLYFFWGGDYEIDKGKNAYFIDDVGVALRFVRLYVEFVAAKQLVRGKQQRLFLVEKRKQQREQF